jgi:hypothetical protein
MPRFFAIDERLQELSAKGDDLERINALVDFEIFRLDLEAAVPRADRSKGGRPPFDCVFMFKVLRAAVLSQTKMAGRRGGRRGGSRSRWALGRAR